MEELSILTLYHFPSASSSDSFVCPCFTCLCTGPAIDIQPSDVNVKAGGTATFTVEASGEGLSYQWFGPGGNALTDVDRDIEGSNSSTLQIINVESGDAGDYTVVVTNSAGSVTSDAAILSIG